MMHCLGFLLLGLLASDSGAAAVPPPKELWAGHEVLEGKRKIPLYGEKDTHTENYYLAEVHREAGRIEILEKLCKIEIRPIKGVAVTMKPTTVERLPKSHFFLAEQSDGTLHAEPWTDGWDSEDIDADGFPGATIEVSGTSCSGELYVSNQSVTSMSRGRATSDGIVGEVSVRLKQRVLSARGFCLKMMAGDSDATQTGTFVFRRVDPSATCQTLAAKAWPVHAASAQKSDPK